MTLFLREIIQSSNVSDASLIPNFILESEQDVLAIARGNILYIYQIGNIQDSLPIFYEFNNPIKLVRPIYNDSSTNSNILIVFSNFRACILSPNGESLSNFSLVKSSDLFSSIEFKCELHPKLVAIQLSPHHIEIYRKTENCLLSYVTSISIGCKSIIDFCFFGPTTKVEQLAVLLEEFDDSPRFQIISINSANRTYREEPDMSVKLAKDSYLLYPINPLHSPTVFVLNSSQCIIIKQKSGKLKTTSATICTADKILNCDHLHSDIFCYIDEAGDFGYAQIKEKDTVSFEVVGHTDKPFKIIALTHNLMLAASHESFSRVFKLKKNNSVKLIRTFQNTGRIKKVSRDNNDYMAISDKGSISIKPIEKVNLLEKVIFCGGLRIFSYKNSFIVSKNNETFELVNGEIKQDSTFSRREKTIFVNEIIHCTENEMRLINGSVITDKFRICDASQNFFSYVNDKNEIHLFSLSVQKDPENSDEDGRIQINYSEIPIPSQKCDFGQKYEDDPVVSISINDLYLAVLTSSITIYQLSNMKIVKMINSPNTVDIKLFGTDGLISLDESDFVRVHSINNLNEKTILCEGSHTNICECNGFHVIGGSQPSILMNNSIVRIDCEPFYDAVCTGPNEISFLNFNGIQKVRLMEKGYKNKCSISTIPISSFTRLNNEQYVYSRTKNDTTYFFLNKSEKPFYSCQNFVSIGNVKNTLNIICKNSVTVFNEHFSKVNELSFDKEILNFTVNHSKRYIYQKYSLIDLETRNPIFNSNEDQPISFLSMNHRYTVFVINDDTLVLFVVNDDNSYRLPELIPLYENVTCLALNGDIVLIGTSNCKLLMFKIVDNSRIERNNSINLMSLMPTSIDKFENSFIVGFNTGSILELKLANIEPRFEELIALLQNRMKCKAGLTKNDQFFSEKVLYDEKKEIVFDVSILSRFVYSDKSEQKRILGEKFQLDEAIKLIMNYNNLFLS